MVAWIYILHFDHPLGKTNIQHYAGYTKAGIAKRMWWHRNGLKGFVSRIVRSGNDFKVVHIERFNTLTRARERERELKREGKLRSHCSICRKKKGR